MEVHHLLFTITKLAVEQEYMPLPPEDVSEIDDKLPDFKFSYVECLMYSLHQLGRRTPSLLTDDQHSDRLRDFRSR